MLVQRAELQTKFIRVSVLVVRKWISKTVMRAPTMFSSQISTLWPDSVYSLSCQLTGTEPISINTQTSLVLFDLWLDTLWRQVKWWIFANWWERHGHHTWSLLGQARVVLKVWESPLKFIVTVRAAHSNCH